MKEPVLVRRVTDLGGLSEVEFAQQSNKQQVLGMGEAENAVADGKMLNRNPALMAMFNVDESGNVLAAGNQGFLAAFVEATGHRAALSAGDGWNGPVLSRRVKNAILSAFLGGEDRQVISQLVEGADELGIKNVANALMGAALADEVQGLALRHFRPGPPGDQRPNQHTDDRREAGRFPEQQAFIYQEPTGPGPAIIWFAHSPKLAAPAIRTGLERYAGIAAEAMKGAEVGADLLGHKPLTQAEVLRKAYEQQPQPPKQENLPIGQLPPGRRPGPAPTRDPVCRLLMQAFPPKVRPSQMGRWPLNKK